MGVLLLSFDARAAGLTALGVLPAPSPRSQATAVTPDGRFVVGYANSGSGSEAFRWSATEGIRGLGDLPGGELRSEAFAISADGGTVVGAAFPGGGVTFEPFRWTPGEGLQRLGGGLPATFLGASANDMTPDGQVVVGSVALASGPGVAYRWTADGGYTVLQPLPPGTLAAGSVAVSSDGRTVAGNLFLTDSESEGFRWTAETGVVVLGGQLAGKAVASEVTAISGDGRFITGLVLYKDTRNLEMFRWSAADGFVALGHLPKGERWSIGYGISDDGRVVVGEAHMEVRDPSVPFPVVLPRAAVWREGSGLKPLWDLLVGAGVNPAADGWESLVVARGVSGDGRFVVGSGRRNGRTEAFLADLAPQLALTQVNGRWMLSWPSGFRLQRNDSLRLESWVDMGAAVSPWEVGSDGDAAFFRIVSSDVTKQ